MLATKPNHAVYFGPPGSGKSTLLACDYAACPLPAYIVDPQGEHCARPGDVIERNPLDPSQCAADMARAAYDRGNCQLVIDESDLCWFGQEPPFEVIFVARRGRHRNVLMRLATQRPVAIPRNISASACEISIFSTTDSRDMEYFAKLGLSPEKMRLTAPYMYWHYRRDLPRWHTHHAPLTLCDVRTG